MMPRSVTIVVLNWNRHDLTLDCLASLAEVNYPAEKLQIVVVDNGSTDDSVARILAAHPNVEIVETGRNLGYAGGNNVGIKCALKKGADCVMILNNDVLVAPEVLSRLIAAASQHPRAGILGPKVYHRERPQQLQSAGIVLDRFWRSYHRGLDQPDVGQFDIMEEVDAVVGCAMLVTRQALECVGSLDPRYFMYREEIDWCCRARDMGFKVLYVPDARVWHRSAQARGEDRARIAYYMTRNSYLLLSRNHAGFSAFAFITLQNLVWLANWTFNPKWRSKREERDALFKALLDALLGHWGRRPYRYGL